MYRACLYKALVCLLSDYSPSHPRYQACLSKAVVCFAATVLSDYSPSHPGYEACLYKAVLCFAATVLSGYSSSHPRYRACLYKALVRFTATVLPNKQTKQKIKQSFDAHLLYYTLVSIRSFSSSFIYEWLHVNVYVCFLHVFNVTFPLSTHVCWSICILCACYYSPLEGNKE